MTTLKNMLDEKGIKQRKICELSGIDDAVLSQIINAKQQPSGPQKALIVYAMNELRKGGPYSIDDFWPENPRIDAGKDAQMAEPAQRPGNPSPRRGESSVRRNARPKYKGVHSADPHKGAD